MDKAQASGDVISQGPPGEPPPPPSGRPRDEDRLTRKPLTFWDRIKFLLLLGLLWFVLVWSAMANDPLVGFSDAMRIEVRAAWWVFLLLGLEVLRQLHFFISEHSAGYTGSGPRGCSAGSSGPPTGGSPTGPGSASGGW